MNREQLRKSVGVREETIRQMERALTEMERHHDRCLRGLIRVEEARREIHAIDKWIEEELPADSDAFRIFDRSRRERTHWWHSTTSGYVSKGDCEAFAARVEVLRRLLDELEPEFLRDEARPKTQYFFPAGEHYRPKERFLRILRRASKELALVDRYLDEAALPYINALDPTIRIRLITGKQKPAFPTLLAALKRDRGNVDARENSEPHDRFVLLDSREAWHVGSSINGFGLSAFMMNRVEDPAELQRLIDGFESWWSKGKLISEGHARSQATSPA